MKNNNATTTKTATMPVTAPALKIPAIASQPVSVVAKTKRNTKRERREAFMAKEGGDERGCRGLSSIGYSLILA
jgi:hypothetical protein